MKRIISITILVLTYQLNAQGAKLMSSEQLDDFGEYDSNEFGFSGSLPQSFSLEKWVPPVTDQEGGTCVAFASVYYSLSTIYNMQFNYTNYQDKYSHAFDPYFIYSIINDDYDYDCNEGLYMSDAVERLDQIGAKKRWVTPYTRCNTDWTSEMQSRVRNYSLPYKIKNYGYLKSYQIEKVKEGIVLGLPVTAMFKLTESFNSSKARSAGSNSIDSDGLWSPRAYEDFAGYHAMTVVGYNDYAYGGAFRVVNSWGDDFGDNGFIWISYSDFEEFCEQAFVFTVDFDENIKSRSQYTRYSTSDGVYEGEYFSNGLNGYGIWYADKSDTYHFGFLDDGSWADGPYIKITPTEFLYGKIDDGYFIDESNLGFAGMDEDEKIILENFKLHKSKLNIGKISQSDDVVSEIDKPKIK